MYQNLRMKQINKKNECDYLDLSVKKSSDMLNDCIGNNYIYKMSKSILDNTVDNSSIGNIIEPFGNIDRVNSSPECTCGGNPGSPGCTCGSDFGDCKCKQANIIEPFGNIDRVNCPSRVPGELECPDGYTNIDGVCKQVCVHCDYNDATGYFGNCTDNNGVYKNNRSPEYMDYVNEDFMYISSFN